MDPKTEAWRTAAHGVITELAKSNTHIVSDMLITALEEAGHGLTNYSALGGVFKRAAKAGLIVKTDEAQPGNRKSHSVKTVWRSLVYTTDVNVSPELQAVSNMIISALEYNAAVVSMSSVIYAQGIKDRQHHAKIVNEFDKVYDQYTAQHVAIMENLAAQLERKANAS